MKFQITMSELQHLTVVGRVLIAVEEIKTIRYEETKFQTTPSEFTLKIQVQQ